MSKLIDDPTWREHFELGNTGTPHVYVRFEPKNLPFGPWSVFAFDGEKQEVRFAWSQKRGLLKGERLIRKAIASRRSGPAPSALLVVNLPR